MKGTHEVTVKNNRVQYKFTLRRNLTILRGNSATGKTTLIDLIAQYARDGENSGVFLQCDKPCIVLTSDLWQIRLSMTKDSIVFIDEDNAFVSTQEFAELVKKSDNYYVIAMREALPQLPYSVEEIYTLKNVTRGYGKVKRLYTSFAHIYQKELSAQPIPKPDVVIVEDSNAGYQFFKNVFEEQRIRCIYANGKSNICAEIAKTPVGCVILVIADGAAFGPEMEKTLAQHGRRNIALFLPESFEWLILSSELLNRGETKQMLKDPSVCIESSQYFSWERFFTSFLVGKTKDTYLQYNKANLNPHYLQQHEKKAIQALMPEYKA